MDGPILKYILTAQGVLREFLKRVHDVLGGKSEGRVWEKSEWRGWWVDLFKTLYLL